MVFAFIIISIVQDSSCNFMETMLTSSSPSSELAKLNIELDNTFKVMIDAALVEGGSANLEKVLPDVDFTQVDELLDGLSSF